MALFQKRDYPGVRVAAGVNSRAYKPPYPCSYFVREKHVVLKVIREGMRETLAPVKHLEDGESRTFSKQPSFLGKSHVKLPLGYLGFAGLPADFEYSHVSCNKHRAVGDTTGKHSKIFCNTTKGASK
jgi:hypothetical protein